MTDNTGLVIEPTEEKKKVLLCLLQKARF